MAAASRCCHPNVLDNREGLPQAVDGGAFASSDRDEFYVLFDQMLMRQATLTG